MDLVAMAPALRGGPAPAKHECASLRGVHLTDLTDRRSFILSNTRLQRPPHVPELQLYLADEVTPLWRMTEETLGALGLPPPFWAFAWAGGQALGRFILDHPTEVLGKSVLDFASGSGLVAIAAMRSGAAGALAADVDIFCQAALALNCEVNGYPVDFVCADLLKEDPPAVDVILAGDIFYERPVAEPAIAWLKSAHRRGTRVLMGDPGRSYFPKADLVQLAEYRVATSRDLEDQDIKRTGVFAFPN